MNEKTAKRLRKIALGMVVAAEEQGQKIERVAYLQNKDNGNIVVAKKTWKGAYKSLKKGLRKATMASAWNQALANPQTRLKALAAAA